MQGEARESAAMLFFDPPATLTWQSYQTNHFSHPRVGKLYRFLLMEVSSHVKSYDIVG